MMDILELKEYINDRGYDFGDIGKVVNDENIPQDKRMDILECVLDILAMAR